MPCAPSEPARPFWRALSPTPQGATKELRLTAYIAGGPASDAVASAPPPPPPRGGPLPPAAEAALDAILILRIEDGSDAFISVSGSYVRSCFGRDLSDLADLGPAPAAPRGAVSERALALRAVAGDAGRAAAAAEGGAAAARADGGTDDRSSSGGLLIDMGEEGGGSSGGPTGTASASAATAPETEVAAGGMAVELPAPPSVPKEIACLTAFLARHLDCPGLFLHSCEAASGLPPRGRQPRGRQQVAQLLAATADVRWALDLGEQLPLHATPHQVGRPRPHTMGTRMGRDGVGHAARWQQAARRRAL
jgi:hypothetical protein